MHPAQRGILGEQSLEPTTVPGFGTDLTPNGLAGDEMIHQIEADVPSRSTHSDEVTIDARPESQARSATKGLEFPLHLVAAPCVLQRLGCVSSRHGGFGNMRRGRSHSGELYL